MTTQTVNVDAFGYTGTFSAKLRDPDMIATLVATADTVAASGTIASRFVCTFGEIAVIPAGVYLLEFIVNGTSYILYVTLTGVDGEVALARSERGVVLGSAARVKLDATQPDYAPALASTALSTAQWTNTLATNLGTTNTTVAANLNATVSSRSTYAGGAVASVTAPVSLDSATAAKISRIEAVATGTVTGAGTSTEVFVGPSATLTITVDASGNRSAVVVT